MAQNLSWIYKCLNSIEYVFFSRVKGYRTLGQMIADEKIDP